MIRYISKYKIMMLLICFYPFLSTQPYSAESEYSSNEELFLNFERELINIIDFSIDPLLKLDGIQNEEVFYNTLLLTEQSLAKGSLSLLELKVPKALPHDTKIYLGRTKQYVSIGLQALEEAMTYYARYIGNPSITLYDKYIAKRDNGITYVNGGLTTLASARLQLDNPLEPIQSVWEAGKRNLYRLEKAVPGIGPLNDN